MPPADAGFEIPITTAETTNAVMLTTPPSTADSAPCHPSQSPAMRANAPVAPDTYNGDVNGVEINAVVKAGNTGLVDGTNYLCAELHQSATTSSDAVFGARLIVTPGASASTAALRLNEVHFTGSAVDWVGICSTRSMLCS